MKGKIVIFVTLCLFQTAVSHPLAAQVASRNVSDDNTPAKLVNVDISGESGSNIWQRAAVENGMDPVAVAEVVRTGRPVVKIENGENGTKRTITYSLQPDGSISRHTKTEYRPTLVSSSSPKIMGNSKPILLPNLPAEKGLRPHKETDWEWNPSSLPTHGTPSTSSSGNFPQWTTNWEIPTFTFAQRPRVSQIPTAENVPQYWPTSVSPTQTDIRSGFDTNNAGTVTKTFSNGDNTKITTVHTVTPTEWHTKIVTFPSAVPNSTKTTTTTTTESTNTTIPSLEDFLKSQYATTTSKSPTEIIRPSSLPRKPFGQSTPKPVTTININDLPAVEVLHTDNPLVSRTHSMPNFGTETKTYTKTIHTSGIPTESDLDANMKEILERAGISPMDVLTSKDGTVTKTRTQPDGKVITTTYRIRTVPMDSNSVGDVMASEKPQGPFFVRERPVMTPGHGGNQFTTTSASNVPNKNHDFGTASAFDRNWHSFFPQQDPSIHGITKSQKHKNPIDEFLAKVNLTAPRISASNGEIVKTIVDDDGRVLTASFVLSTVRNDESHLKNKAESAPIKRFI